MSLVSVLSLEASMPVWLKWAFWVSPLTYGEIGMNLNEFLAPRWQKALSANTTVGRETLESRGLNFDSYFYWISLGVLFGLSVLFNIGFTLALTFLKPPGISRALISSEKLSQLQGKDNCSDSNVGRKLADALETRTEPKIVTRFGGERNQIWRGFFGGERYQIWRMAPFAVTASFSHHHRYFVYISLIFMFSFYIDELASTEPHLFRPITRSADLEERETTFGGSHHLTK